MDADHHTILTQAAGAPQGWWFVVIHSGPAVADVDPMVFGSDADGTPIGATQLVPLALHAADDVKAFLATLPPP